MPKKACCQCVAKRSCCNPTLYENFITLYGNTMLTASPVHPTDILVLRMNRPGVQRSPRILYKPPVSGTDPCECDCSG
jgi:hypothetical protein